MEALKPGRERLIFEGEEKKRGSVILYGTTNQGKFSFNRMQWFWLLLFLPTGLLFSGENSRTELPRKCDFPQLIQAAVNPQAPGSSAYLSVKNEILSAQRVSQVYYSPSGHFAIYYQTTGYDSIPSYDRNQNGTPDYLEFVGRAFDRAWEVEIDSLGFRPPPDSLGNNRSVYPVYCRRLSSYGSTYPIYEIPELPGNNYVSFIQINTNFSFVNYPGTDDPVVRDSMAIAVTAAHEFNHALQLGYNFWLSADGFNSVEDIWYIESSATYMEEVVAPDVNDYLNYLPSFFQRLDRPLDESTGSFQDYGKVVVEIMLGELYGRQITRQVWEEMLQYRAIRALDRVLQSFGTALPAELARLSLWIYFSGAERTIPGEYFPDAALFPALGFQRLNPVEDLSHEILLDSLDRLTLRYYSSELQVSNPVSTMLQAASHEMQKFSLFFVDRTRGEYFLVPAGTPVFFSPAQYPANFDLAVVNGIEYDSSRISYRVYMNPQQQAGDQLTVYPQPFRLSGDGSLLKFVNVPREARIRIFSANGKLLKTLKNESDSPFLQWDLHTDSGESIASGVYIYYLESPQREEKGKFVILR